MRPGTLVNKECTLTTRPIMMQTEKRAATRPFLIIPGHRPPDSVLSAVYCSCASELERTRADCSSTGSGAEWRQLSLRILLDSDSGWC
jgi:hypothetical protein